MPWADPLTIYRSSHRGKLAVLATAESGSAMLEYEFNMLPVRPMIWTIGLARMRASAVGILTPLVLTLIMVLFWLYNRTAKGMTGALYTLSSASAVADEALKIAVGEASATVGAVVEEEEVVDEVCPENKHFASTYMVALEGSGYLLYGSLSVLT